jgi:segregation and condensation protein B
MEEENEEIEKADENQKEQEDNLAVDILNDDNESTESETQSTEEIEGITEIDEDNIELDLDDLKELEEIADELGLDMETQTETLRDDSQSIDQTLMTHSEEEKSMKEIGDEIDDFNTEQQTLPEPTVNEMLTDNQISELEQVSGIKMDQVVNPDSEDQDIDIIPEFNNPNSTIEEDTNQNLETQEELYDNTEETATGIEGEKVTIKELTERSKKKIIIEAAMFIAGRPVSIEEMGIKLDIKKKETEELVYELAMEYLDRSSAIEIVKIGDNYSMQIKAELTENVKKFSSGGLIPEAVMRTLTVIALKQPISKAKLVKMRGSGAYQHVKFLVDRGYLDSYKKGRSSILETTEQFSDQFGMSKDKKKLKEQLIDQLGISPSEDSVEKPTDGQTDQ